MNTYIITRYQFGKNGNLCGRVDIAYTEEEGREMYARLRRTLNRRGYTRITLESSSKRAPLSSHQIPEHKRDRFVRVSK